MKNPLVAAVAAVSVLLLSACGAHAPVGADATERTPTQVQAEPVERTPEPVVVTTPTPTPTATLGPGEAEFLAMVDTGLTAAWYDDFRYTGTTGLLDLGYAICGLYEAGWDRAQVVEFLEPNYTNPRWYSDDYSGLFADASATHLCE